MRLAGSSLARERRSVTSLARGRRRRRCGAKEGSERRCGAPKKALGRDPPGRDHLSDDVVGRRKDIPRSEPQNPIALLDEFILTPTIRPKCAPVGVVALSVEFDDQPQVEVDEIHAGNSSASAFYDANLRDWKLDSGGLQDSEKLVLELG